MASVPKTNKIEPRSYSIIPSCGIQAARACFEHSNFFKVNASGPAGHSAKSIEGAPRGKGRGRRTARPLPRSNYELFNCSNFNIRYWSWNYLCMLLAPDLPSNGSSLKDLKWTHSNYRASKESCIVIFRHYLPGSGVGNLRACCLPWMW